MINKTNIVTAIKDENMTKKEAEKIVDTVFSYIVESVNNGEVVNISGFGKFERKAVKERTARNPKTGETVMVPAKNKLGFKVSKKFLNVLNSVTENTETVAAEVNYG